MGNGEGPPPPQHMAQWVTCFLHKSEDLNSDSQSPSKIRVGWGASKTTGSWRLPSQPVELIGEASGERQCLRKHGGVEIGEDTPE